MRPQKAPVPRHQPRSGGRPRRRRWWAVLSALTLVLTMVVAVQLGDSGPDEAAGAAANPLPVFPGAQGAGTQTPGGRGGTVHVVTSLADAGAGTLRACVEASGPRICTFATGGTIELQSSLYITDPFLTVAGQTAPGGGIQITNAPGAVISNLVLVSTHDVVWAYTRARNQYRPACSDAGNSECGALMSVQGRGYNVVFAHNSLAWNQDEGFGVWRGGADPVHDVTMTMNLVAEGLDSHSTGMIMGGSTSSDSGGVTDIDFHHNLVMNNNHRNPLMKGRSGRVVNNIFYNQRFYTSQFGGGGSYDVIGNAYVKGPLAADGGFTYEVQAFTAAGTDAFDGSPSLHLAGNTGWRQTDPAGDQWAMTGLVSGENGREQGAMPAGWRRSSALAPTAVPLVAEPVGRITGGSGSVAPTVGASRRLDCNGAWVESRDPVDTRLVGQYVTNTGIRTLPSRDTTYGPIPTLARGTACADTDADGMPDAWERARLGSLAATPSADADGDGYTNIEAWLWGIGTSAPPAATTSTTAKPTTTTAKPPTTVKPPTTTNTTTAATPSTPTPTVAPPTAVTAPATAATVTPPATGKAHLSGWVGGRRARSTSGGTDGVAVALYATNPDGSRGVHVADAVTAARGRFGFDVGAGCYTVVVTAPDGRTFNRRGSTTAERRVCVEAGRTVGTLTFRLR